ncbi:MAG: hypothetical protein EOP34_03340 [Rickettsiales bacterium]|nr:MAG: hypothetical protein EOP34_03340 [Rickettsiales bacterium]
MTTKQKKRALENDQCRKNKDNIQEIYNKFMENSNYTSEDINESMYKNLADYTKIIDHHRTLINMSTLGMIHRIMSREARMCSKDITENTIKKRKYHAPYVINKNNIVQQNITNPINEENTPIQDLLYKEGVKILNPRDFTSNPPLLQKIVPCYNLNEEADKKKEEKKKTKNMNMGTNIVKNTNINQLKVIQDKDIELTNIDNIEKTDEKSEGISVNIIKNINISEENTLKKMEEDIEKSWCDPGKSYLQDFVLNLNNLTLLIDRLEENLISVKKKVKDGVKDIEKSKSDVEKYIDDYYKCVQSFTNTGYNNSHIIGVDTSSKAYTNSCTPFS